MSTPLKQHKETEGKLHEHLYNNILLLTHIYPTTKEFDAVFRKDMFIKSNKAAFHHVVYYLLNILNPELTKEKISAWPLYEVKLESKFRMEVLAYVNELNTLYEAANIPMIVSSHLISPGGFKFIRFMWKLSQLVIREHLKESSKEITAQILNPIERHKNPAITNIILKNQKQKVDVIQTEITEKYENAMRNYENASLEASHIIFEQSELNKELDECVKTHETMKKMSQTNDENIQESLISRINYIKSKNVAMEEMKELCNKCNDLLSYLSSNECVLECDKGSLILPKIIGNLSENNDGIDLHDLLSKLINILEKENLTMPLFTAEEVNNVIIMMEELIEKYLRLHEKHTYNKTKFQEAVDKFHQFIESRLE